MRKLLLVPCAALVVLASGESRAQQLGDPLPGTDPVAFMEATRAFVRNRSIEDGLGPTFNATSCSGCHALPVVGGFGAPTTRRFGRVSKGVFFGFDSDEENQTGTLRQLFSNGTYLNGAVACTIPLDTEPSDANVRTDRRTTPLFGLGLVDAMPDAWFDFLAALQPASVRGAVQRVPVVLPDPRDPTQSIGSLRVGRFGTKGRIPSLLEFAADELDLELGVTTQSCSKGVSVLEFAVENHPNNIEPPDGCNGGDLAPAQPPGNPDVPEFVDEAVGSCEGGRTDVQDDLILFRTFMERLAPPPRAIGGNIAALVRGGVAFGRAGCASCHVPVFITPRAPFNGAPGSFVFFPFSDFLVHDMGSLGDGIAASGEPESQGNRIRTTPLWGARFTTAYLHDGRAPTIRDAILAHDGQGAAARERFSRLPLQDQKALVDFVNSL